MTNSLKNKTAGFTLIEMMVVISIIGMLSSVVLSALNAARAKGRDATLIGAAQELQKAVELYYHNNGMYPPHTAQIASNCPATNVVACYTNIDGIDTEGVFLGALTPTYLSVLPKPGFFTNANKNSNSTSRLMYRRITNAAAIAGSNCTAAAGNCYAILFYTEGNTGISTANTAAYFLSNGTTRKTFSNTIY